MFTIRERNTGTETFQLDDKDCKITEMGFSLVISLECCNSLITLTCDLIVTQLETPDSGRNNEFYFPYTFSSGDKMLTFFNLSKYLIISLT